MSGSVVGNIGQSEEQCPWCESIIPHAKFVEIERKIRRQEEQRLEAVRTGLERQFASKLQGAQRAAAQAAAGQVAAANAQRDAAVKKSQQLAVNIEAERKKAFEEADRRAKIEIGKQRELLDRERTQALLKRDAVFARERDAYQKKLSELERRLQKKTADELGEGAEVDLYEVLKEQFPDDRITRVKKGEAGADILQRVIHKGRECGKIIFDSKNRQGWHDSYVTKLREDQVEAEADHAVLTTTVFRRGDKELAVEKSGVIVVNPARAVHVVDLLRTFTIRMNTIRASNSERSTKTTRLYEFINSERYSVLAREADEFVDKTLNIDVQEKKEHDKTWRERGYLAKRLKNALVEIETEIATIIGGSSNATEDSSAV